MNNFIIIVTGKIFSCDIVLPETRIDSYLESIRDHIKKTYLRLYEDSNSKKKFKEEYKTKVVIQKIN